MIVYWILLLVTAVVAYALGSMSTIVLASNFIFHYNLRRLGHGNDFLSNFKRVYGLKGALKLLFVEAVKDTIPIVIGGLLLGIKGHPETGRAFAGFCLVIGRLWPLYYNLRGSHAVMPMIFTGLFAAPSLGIAVAVVFLGTLFASKRMTLATCVMAVVMAIAPLLIIDDKVSMYILAITSGMIIVRHIPALIRMFKGQEEKINFREDLSYKFDQKFI